MHYICSVSKIKCHGYHQRLRLGPASHRGPKGLTSCSRRQIPRPLLPFVALLPNCRHIPTRFPTKYLLISRGYLIFAVQKNNKPSVQKRMLQVLTTKKTTAMVITIFIIIEVLFSATLFIGTHLVEKLSDDEVKPPQHRFTTKI